MIRPRYRNLATSICLALGALCLLLPLPSAALQYQNASPAGAQFPAWDGGDTELEFADVNGDGHLDLLSIGDHGSPYINTTEHGVMVYFGDGAGAWTIHQEGNFGYGGIAAGDVNRDGILDVAYGMHHNYSGVDLGNQLIEVALGDGTGMHWTPWDDGLATGGETYGMAATDFADFDNDGDIDLVSNSFGCCNGVHAYRNNGDGTWIQTYSHTTGNATCFVRTGDVNGDGFADFAASFQYGCVYLGDGEGSFSHADTGLAPLGTSGLAGITLRDVDGDGCDDIAFVRNGGVYVYLWRADHWENASTGLPASGAYRATELADMDGDGWVDLVAMQPGSCTIWLGNGGTVWAPGGGFTTNPGSDIAAFRAGGDIDHNGRPDVAFLQEQGSGFSYRNYLYVYKEATFYTGRAARVESPQRNHTVYMGSAQTIRWSSARLPGLPASARIQVSTTGPDGPWELVAENLPDNGHHQWIVPGPPSAQAHVRVTVTQDGVEVSAVSEAFTIVSSNPVDAPEIVTGLVGVPRLLARPNPTSGATTLALSLASPGLRIAEAGRLWITDPGGRRIRALDVPGGVLREGRADIVWDGRTDAGHLAPAGIYAATWVGGDSRAVARVVIVRR